MSKVQRRELIEWRQSKKYKEGHTSKRQRFSRGDSRNEVTRTLVSKLVAKDLGEMEKAEKKEEVKGKELNAQVMDVPEKIKTTNQIRCFHVF